MTIQPSRHSQKARRARSLATPQRQRGAAAIFGALAILAGIIATLLGINIGMLYFAQRDLQKQATLAAMAGVQIASGCRGIAGAGGTPGSLAAVSARIATALATNHDATNAADVLSSIGGQPAVQLGQTTHSGTTYGFTPLNAGNPAIDTVRVNMSGPAPTPLTSLFNSTPHTLYASATAWQPAYGGFSIGSGLVNLDTATGTLVGPLLGGLLHTNINLSAVDYNGLAQAQVNLAGLEAAAGVTNLNDLLSLQTNLSGALNILGQAVSGSTGGLISGLAGDAYNSPGSGTQPTQAYFGNLLDNVGGSFNPLVTDVASSVPFVNALGLLTALGEDASQNQAISLQPPNSFLTLLNIPGLSSLQIYLTVIQPPQFAVGPALPTTMAQTAQIVLGVRTSVTLSALLSASLGVDLNVAAATGTLSSLQCPVSGKPNPIATVAVSTNVANLTVGSFNPAATNEPLGGGTLLNVLGGLATIKLSSGKVGPVTVGTTLSQSTGPYDTYTAVQGLTTTSGNSFVNQTAFTAVAPDNTDTVGSSALLASTIDSALTSLTSSNNLQVCTLGICLPLGSILSTLTPLLETLATALDTVLQDLEQLLGLSLGTATVTMQGATIGQPILVTTCLPITEPNGVAAPPGVCAQ